MQTMEINWEEMGEGEEPETGLEQQHADLVEQAEQAPCFLFPEDFKEDE